MLRKFITQNADFQTLSVKLKLEIELHCHGFWLSVDNWSSEKTGSGPDFHVILSILL